MPFSIGGLGTGWDTNEMVEQLMQLERRPVYLLQNQQKGIQADLNAWEAVDSKLTALQDSVEGISSIFDKMSVTVDDSEVVDVTTSSTATPASYNLDITQLAQTHAIASDQQGDSSSDLGLTGTFQINGVDITVNATDSLTDIQNTINNTSGTGVNATIIDDQMVLKAEASGTANEITLTDDDMTDILENLGLINTGTTSDIKNELQTAKDAIFSLDGLQITRSSNEIDDVIEGVTLNLKQEGSSTQFTVDKDTDGMIEGIKALVDKYNSTTDKIDSFTGIDGELQGDITLNGLKFKLRRCLSDRTDTSSSINQLALIGIEADRYGEFSVDEEELRAKLNDNFAELKDLFTAEESSAGYSGIAERLSNYLGVALDSEGPVSGSQESLQNRMDDIDEQILSLERRLELRERNLKKQWQATETAVAQMNNQMSWLSGQFSSLTAGGLFGSTLG